MGASFMLLFAIAYGGIWARTIGWEPVNVGGTETVMATVLDNRQIVYRQGMTHTSVSVETGRLLTVSAVPGSNGLMIMRRNPTASEEQLWIKYFGVSVAVSVLPKTVVRAQRKKLPSLSSVPLRWDAFTIVSMEHGTGSRMWIKKIDIGTRSATINLWYTSLKKYLKF